MYQECEQIYATRILRGVLGLPDGYIPPESLRSWVTALKWMNTILLYIPMGWVLAARSVIERRVDGIIPPEKETWSRIARSVGWRIGRTVVKLPDLTVRIATHLQMSAGYDALEMKHIAFIKEARGVAEIPMTALTEFRDTLKRLWYLRWDNEHKEALWRLAVNGFPAARLRGNVTRCPCSAAMIRGDRIHLFWECTVARALCDMLRFEVGENVELTKVNLWLGIPPLGIHTLVWDIVCLAALSALERGGEKVDVQKRTGGRKRRNGYKTRD
ncbi:hypothetical protein Agub_g4149 [Astrephomene gubernaculifera]|uniref:Uncharacterized protein n=1 Tax=Astrephomene gubernaculifera TaxID=47775 RepID=A0AAD3DM57_9CHLO|nr:hypothetical protein Agub_g4149 [Astrephomene gubernaculifera]